MSLTSARPRAASFLHATTYDEAFLSFVRHLLEGRLAFPSRPLPHALHREAVERAAEMLPRAILRFLARGGGWQLRPLARNGRVSRVRLWEAPRLQSLDLRFGAASISLLLHLFEAGARAIDGEAPAEETVDTISSCLNQLGEQPAELLLVHLAMLPFARHERPPRTLVSLLCRGNGLNQLTAGTMHDVGTPPIERDVRESMEQWGWALPWLGPHVAGWWARSYGRLFAEGLEGFVGTSARLRDAQALVLHYVREHDDSAALGPLLAFYAALFSADMVPDEVCEPLEWLIEELPHRARQEHREAWAAALDGALQLETLRQEALHEHPLARADGQRWLLATWEAMELDPVMARVRSLRAHLLRVIR